MLPNFSASVAWMMQYTYFPRVLVAVRVDWRPSGVPATSVSCIRTSVSEAARASGRTRPTDTDGRSGSGRGFAAGARVLRAGDALSVLRGSFTSAFARAFFAG